MDFTKISMARMTLSCPSRSGERRRVMFAIAEDISYELLWQHVKDSFASAYSIAVDTFKVWFELEREGIPLLIASDLVLRLCLNDYINECKATGQRISPHFIAEEMAEFGPQQQQLATREESKHILPESVKMKSEMDVEPLFQQLDFDTIDGPAVASTVAQDQLLEAIDAASNAVAVEEGDNRQTGDIANNCLGLHTVMDSTESASGNSDAATVSTPVVNGPDGDEESGKPIMSVGTPCEDRERWKLRVVFCDDPGSVKSDDLRAAFEAKGATVADAFVPEGKAFGFVSFSSQEEAEKYGKSGLFPFKAFPNDRYLNVQWVSPRKSRAGGEGGLRFVSQPAPLKQAARSVVSTQERLFGGIPSKSGALPTQGAENDNASSTASIGKDDQKDSLLLSSVRVGSASGGKTPRIPAKPKNRQTKKISDLYTTRKSPKKPLIKKLKTVSVSVFSETKAGSRTSTRVKQAPKRMVEKTPSKRSKTPKKAVVRPSLKSTPVDLVQPKADRVPIKLPEGYNGLRWLTETCPRRIPYSPQVGDVVNYYPDIHKRYRTCVSALSFVSPKVKKAKHQPFSRAFNLKLKKVETLEVLSVDFEIISKVYKNRLVIVNLERKNCGVPGKKKMTIYLQEMPDDAPQEADFLVLKQFVDDAEEHFRQKGKDGYLKKRAKLMFLEKYEEKWANGRIELVRDPKKDAQPLTFLWDALPGQEIPSEEPVSLWDVFLYPDEGREVEHDSSVNMTERRETAYRTESTDWTGDSDVFRKRLSAIVDSLLRMDLVDGLPMELDEKKWRLDSSVAYPMTLRLMEERLLCHYYRRKKSIEVDIKHLLTTIELVSDKEEFKLKTRIICDVLTKGINDLDFRAVHVAEYVQLKEAVVRKDLPVIVSKKRPRPIDASSGKGPSIALSDDNQAGHTSKKSRFGREFKSPSTVQQSLGSMV